MRTRHGLGIICAAAIVVVTTGCDTPESKDQSDLEHQYISMAKEMESIKPCLLISPTSKDYAPFNTPGTRSHLRRSDCFRGVAFKTRNAALCDRVVPTNEKSGLTAENCRLLLSNTIPPSASGGANIDMQRLLPVMGYSEAEAATWSGTKERLTVFDRQRMTQFLRTEEFFRRVDRLPSFGTAADMEEMKSLQWSPSGRLEPSPGGNISVTPRTNGGGL